MSITYYCYLASFLAYLALTVLLVAGWRGHAIGRWLIAACAMMALWAGGIAMQERYGAFPVAAVWTLETLHSFMWLVFFWKVLSREEEGPAGASRVVFIYRWGQSATVLLLAYIWCSPYLQGRYPRIFLPAYQLLGHVGLVVAGLVLVEQFYRNTRTDERWRIKLLCFALGTLFVYEFYLYSEAILFLRVKPDLWAARGVVAAMLVPFIAVSAMRNPDWSLGLFISRQVVFHSTALLGAGCYLLLMATAGYYIKYYGGEWGAVLQIAFLVGAFLVLAVVLFSGQIRAKVRIFIGKHFFQHAFDYRQEWQRLIATLSESQGGSLGERVILALSQVVESPGGVLWVRDRSGKFVWRASLGPVRIDIPELDGDDPVIAYMERKDALVNLKEVLTMPEAYEGLNEPLWVEPYRQAWLLIPLWKTAGGIDGLVLLTDSPSFAVWNLEVMDMLKTTSRLVATYLELEAAARALAEARQFEGFNRLSAFIIHDLKNLIAQLSLVVRNADKHHDNPEFMRDAIKTVDHAVGKMNAVMSQLRNSSSVAAAEKFDLRTALLEAVEARKRQAPAPNCDKVGSPVAVLANRQRLVSALEHVIHNAQDAAGKQGWVKVRLRAGGDGWARVEIEDNGGGMSEEFISARLFKPFETTKGLTGMGIGAYESREFARALGGDLSVRSRPGKGSVFVFKIPLAAREADGSSVTSVENAFE
jgi:putative PEP-CTERM system histidine kinase